MSITHGSLSAFLRHVSRVECSHAPHLVGSPVLSPKPHTERIPKLEGKKLSSENICSHFVASDLWFVQNALGPFANRAIGSHAVGFGMALFHCSPKVQTRFINHTDVHHLPCIQEWPVFIPGMILCPHSRVKRRENSENSHCSLHRVRASRHTECHRHSP